MTAALGEPLVADLREAGSRHYVADAAYTCDNCGRLSVVTWWTSVDPRERYVDGERDCPDFG